MKLEEIVVVSGLPRSGTSLMMQMLESGGFPTASDDVRVADADNPRGYYELEAAKRIDRDSSWLPGMRGKAVKLVSQLLYQLPRTECYRIIFMERDLDEVLASQEKMLQRLGRAGGPAEVMKRSFESHLSRLHDWIAKQSHMTSVRVQYNELMAHPLHEANRVAVFLAGQVDAAQMIRAVDPSLYRNR